MRTELLESPSVFWGPDIEPQLRRQAFYSPNKVLSDKVGRDLEFLEKNFGGVLQTLAGERVATLVIRNFWSPR